MKDSHYPMMNASWFVFSLLSFVLVFQYDLPSAAATDTVVKSLQVEGLSSIGREELLDLLDVKTGDVFDPLKVRTGIKRAFLKGIFDDIQVYADAEGAEVSIIVREKERIRKVHITGNYSISGRAIRDISLLKEGQLMRYDRIDEAVRQLKEALFERGFRDADVSMTTVPTTRPSAIDLTITVNEGKPLRVERIVVHGAPDEEVRGVVRIGEGDVYDRISVRRDLEKIRAYYKGLGYLNPGVSHRFADGRLEFEIAKGKRLSVRFEGNTIFSSKQLMKEIPFFEAGEVRDDLIEDTSRKILSLYYGKGYAFAQVAPVMTDTAGTSGDTMEFTVYVFEGESVTVDALTFTGMTLPEKNIKEVLPLKEGDDYNPDLLSSVVDVVREFYIALGYLNIELGEPNVAIDKSRATIAIQVKEGPRTLIERVGISGPVSVSLDEIQKAIRLKQGDPYNDVDIADARLRTMDLYHERGFLDVLVNARVEMSEQSALLTFEIREGERTFVGKTIITGNVDTRREVIARELVHKESGAFSYTALAKERQKLYKLGLFTNVKVEGLDRYDHLRDIHIDVVEGDAGTVDFGFGYSNYEKFTGFVDLGYKNLFGMNRQASLKIAYNSLEKIYALNYYDPWFLDRQLQFRGTVFREEKEEKNIDTKVILYRYRKHGISVGIEKQYTSTTKGGISYDYVLSDTFDVQPDMILTDKDSGKLGIGSLNPSITYDTRDNPFDPRKGVLAGVSVKVASSGLLSETNFVKTVFNGSLYQELSRYFVLAVALRAGAAQGFGSNTILPLVERFFLGGRSSVRGYAQDTLGPRGVDGNPTGGNAFIATNLELRTSLGKGLGLVTFLDSGNVWQKIGDIDWSLKHAVGAGLRYNTPVGPFRLDYGYKVKREPGLSRSEIFFSIGQAF
jgi:outer membrane protein insertion porin family